MIYMSRNAFRIGLELITQRQKELGRPTERSKINKIVHYIVKEAGLEEDKRKRSFVLLATCAMLGRESMHYNYKFRRHKYGKANSAK
jgi:hypothetical protein